MSIVTSKDAFVPGPWAVSDPGVPIAQSLIYIFAVGVLAWSLMRIRTVLCAACSVGLLVNPFVVVYLSQRLTEGLVVSLFVLLSAIAIRICSQPSRAALFFLVVMGSLTVGFAQVTRPACFPVLIAWLVLLIVVSIRARSFSKAIALALATLTGLSLTLTPQIIYNAIHFDKYTFLPAYDLGGFQIEHGLKILKYHTMIDPAAPNGATGIVLSNPLLTKDERQEFGSSIYFVNPIAGLMTATMHVLNSINHDYFYVYLSSTDPRPYAPANAAWHFILFMAVSASFGMLREFRNAASSNAKFDVVALAALLGVSVLGTLLVNSLTAAETRFGILIFLLAGPLSIVKFLELRNDGLEKCSIVLLQGAMYAICASTISTLLTMELVR